MKANELRIGNYVKLNGNTTQVDVVDYNQVIATEWGLVELKYIEPIPLTEEWLIKFGFEWIEELFAYADENHYVIFMSSGLIELHPFCTNDEDCHIKVKYVHTLQNLIFALTNEELKLKQ
jgi:hypothetical protein